MVTRWVAALWKIGRNTCFYGNIDADLYLRDKSWTGNVFFVEERVVCSLPNFEVKFKVHHRVAYRLAIPNRNDPFTKKSDESPFEQLSVRLRC
jgi:hypothetical protein